MAYVVTEACIKCKYTDCVTVCPVDCFYEGENFLVINPDQCIDCALCEPECPVNAIYSDNDLPQEQRYMIDLNVELSKEWQTSNITDKRDPLPDADHWATVQDKKDFLVRQLNKVMIKRYDPYSKYASSTDVSLGEFIVEDWRCELVDPRDPALHRSATTDPFKSGIDWTKREKEMLELMHANLGVGLSATQVGSSYNMFVMAHSFLGDIGVYKPSIIETEGEVQIEEGCLTWPLLYLKIKRPAKIKVQFTKTDGKTVVEMWMDGIDARCFLHEYDHLQGTNFIDLVGNFKLQMAKEKRDKRFKRLERSVKRG